MFRCCRKSLPQISQICTDILLISTVWRMQKVAIANNLQQNNRREATINL